MRTCAILMLAFMTAGPASAQETYGKLFGGAVFGRGLDIDGSLDDDDEPIGDLDTKTGFAVGGAVGRKFSPFFGVEGEIAYRKHDLDVLTIAVDPAPDTPTLSSLSFMANGVFSAPGRRGFSPYVGAGLGAARTGGADAHEFGFAYQAFAGLEKSFAGGLSAAVEYRYFSAGDAPYPGAEDALDVDYATHGVNLVLKRSF